MLRWNKVISTAGYDFKLTLPHVAFYRQIGQLKDVPRATQMVSSPAVAGDPVLRGSRD